MDIHVIIAVAVFVATYIVIAFDLLNKATTALCGVALLLITNVITIESAFTFLNLDVIVLLLSMMIIVNIVKETGIFQYLAIKAAKSVRGEPILIMIFMMLITGITSAFLDNVTTILILSPIIILIAVELGITPVPFLITSVIASNIGGVATFIGDPPNMMIGLKAGLSFNDFIVNLAPIALIVLAANTVATLFLERGKMTVTNERRARIMNFDEKQALAHPRFLIFSLTVLGGVIAGFLLHGIIPISAPGIAFIGASILLIAGGKSPERFFNEIEWTTIFFFSGLFILVGTLVELGIIATLGNLIASVAGGNLTASTLFILWGSGFCSGLIDNIPFVATMIPLITVLNNSFATPPGAVLWWALATGAGIGGNYTLVGASANIVAAGISEKNGYKITFMEFTKYGVIYTTIDLFLVMIYLYLRYL